MVNLLMLHLRRNVVNTLILKNTKGRGVRKQSQSLNQLKLKLNI